MDDIFNSCFSLKDIKYDDKKSIMNMNRIKMKIKINSKVLDVY